MASIYNSGKTVGYRLYSMNDERCADVSSAHLLHLLSTGYEVANIKLSERGRIEAVNNACNLRRYTQLGTNGAVLNPRYSKVVIAKFTGTMGVQEFLVFDNTTGRIDIVDSLSIQNKSDYAANLIDITTDNINSTLTDKFKSRWEGNKARYKKFKHSIDSNLNLTDFAIYPEENERQSFSIDNCICITNMHHCRIKELNITGSTYGIGYRAISNLDVSTLNIDSVKIIESEAIQNSKIDTLKLDSDIWFTGTDIMKNCEIQKLIIGDRVLVNNDMLNNCRIHELHFKGERPLLRKELRTFIKGTKIDYIFLSDKIRDKEYERISSMVGRDAEILLQ